MTDNAQYTPLELAALRESIRTGESPVCPRCHTFMSIRPIGGGSFGLGYARKREWLMCPDCRRSALFDVKRGTRT